MALILMAVVMVCRSTNVTKGQSVLHAGHWGRGPSPLNGKAQKVKTTHASAAHGDEEEGLDDAGRADDPRQTDKQDDAKDVLHAREIDAGQRAQLGCHFGLVGSVRVGRSRGRSAVISQGADQGGHFGPLFVLLLWFLVFKNWFFIIGKEMIKRQFDSHGRGRDCARSRSNQCCLCSYPPSQRAAPLHDRPLNQQNKTTSPSQSLLLVWDYLHKTSPPSAL